MNSASLRKENILKIIDWFESLLSVLFFTGMFGSILIQVFFRYILQNPLIWPFELSIYCYIYIVFVGAAMAARRDSHVVFEMFYERFARKTQILIQVLTNLLMIVLFISILPPSLKFMELFGNVKSSSLGIPLYLVLASLPFGFVLIVLYLAGWTVRNLLELKQMRKG